jgi:hypothetical protein
MSYNVSLREDSCSNIFTEKFLMKGNYCLSEKSLGIIDGIVSGVKVTLALKNLIRENLRLARAQFARRECIPRAWFFSSRGGFKKERENGGKKGGETAGETHRQEILR